MLTESSTSALRASADKTHCSALYLLHAERVLWLGKCRCSLFPQVVPTDARKEWISLQDLQVATSCSCSRHLVVMIKNVVPQVCQHG